MTNLSMLIELIEEARKAREGFEEYVNAVIRRMVEETRDYLVMLRDLLRAIGEVDAEKLVLYLMSEEFTVHSITARNCKVMPTICDRISRIDVMELQCEEPRNLSEILSVHLGGADFVKGLKATGSARTTVTTILTLTDKGNIEVIIGKILEKIEERRRNMEMVARKYAATVSPEVQMMLSRLEVLVKTEEGGQQ